MNVQFGENKAGRSYFAFFLGGGVFFRWGVFFWGFLNKKGKRKGRESKEKFRCVYASQLARFL